MKPFIQWRAHAIQTPNWDIKGFKLFMMRDALPPAKQPHKIQVVTGFSCQDVPEFGELPESAAFLPPHEATVFLQGMLDCAWQAGLRPTMGNTDNDAEKAAMKFHLDDMRKLVFKDKK